MSGASCGSLCMPVKLDWGIDRAVDMAGKTMLHNFAVVQKGATNASHTLLRQLLAYRSCTAWGKSKFSVFKLDAHWNGALCACTESI